MSKNNVSNRKKLWLYCIIISVIAGLALLLAFIFMSRTPQATPTPSATEISGTVVCLPHKDSTGPQTLECASGLRTSEGTHYALRNAPTSVTTDYFNKNVRVKGSVSSPGSDEHYDIVGILDVTDVTPVD